uniref:Uncharacterized protein n=1 Tax=Oryza barthii TaxID=65489 RepID=A0A0D3GQI3_9ORYZ
MAMILSAFVSACASKLAGLITDRIAAGLGVEDDVRSMQRRMERVGAVLEDAERRRRRRTGEHEAASAGAWIDELRDFLYDADDVLDLCRCRGDRLPAERRPRSRPLMTPVNLVSSLQKLQARLEIGAQITRLNRRFEEICKDKLFLSLAVDDSKVEDGGSRGGGGGGSRVRTRTSTPLLETNVVGKEIKSATEALVEKIMRDDGRGEVVAVVGMLRDLQHLSRRESICGNLQAVGCSSSLVKLRRLSLMNLEKAMVPCNAISRDRKCFRTLFLMAIPKVDGRLVVKFCGLRTLFLSDCNIGKLPDSIGDMMHLRFLGFDNHGWILTELESLSRLKWLRIDSLEKAAIDNVDIIATKQHLKRLELSCSLKSNGDHDPWDEIEVKKTEAIFEKLLPASCLEDLLIRGFFGRRFPTWMESSSLCNVTWLKLIDCRFCLKFPPLGQLPHLTFLRIVRANSVIAVFPCLRQLELKDCPKLRALPGQLKHATKMQRLRVQGVHALKKIENLHELSGSLRINGSRSLASISELYQIKELYVADCPALQFVNNLNGLKWLYLEDETMDCIPMLAESGEQASGNGLELELHCSTEMLDRCLIGRQDWTILERFTSVAAYCKEDYMCYSRHPVSYHTSKSGSNSKIEMHLS